MSSIHCVEKDRFNRIGSLFSGIGGLELGLEWSGLGHTVWQVEIDESCKKILKKLWPNADRSVTDVRNAGVHNLSKVDIVCGRFLPSGLWHEFVRIVNELCPEWVIIQNVAGGATKRFNIVYTDLMRTDLKLIGYESLQIPVSTECTFIIAINTRCQIGCESHVWRWSCDSNSNTWIPGHNMTKAVNEISNRVYRKRTLGNSIVPQYAEVIGYMILQLMKLGSFQP